MYDKDKDVKKDAIGAGADDGAFEGGFNNASSEQNNDGSDIKEDAKDVWEDIKSGLTGAWNDLSNAVGKGLDKFKQS